ncbi:UNVERIFIED_CONTAM: putative cyclic nucleotide-gated ion channel 10 [Sesamum radiatum]|uniref:Cyclic nucleotide-gated ion channel 10 n=1 Tax=Sesamum radiatum TaxID=300843 RepID=A0AAW2N9U4_SESRA
MFSCRFLESCDFLSFVLGNLERHQLPVTMNQSGNKCARFLCLCSRQFPWRRQPSFSRTVGGIKSYEKTKSLRKGSLDGEHTRSNRPKSSPKKKVVDPQEPFLLVWNKMFFRTGFIVPSSRIYGRGELVEDLGEICRRYLSSYFIIDILSILPLPQVVVISIANAPTSPATKIS